MLIIAVITMFFTVTEIVLIGFEIGYDWRIFDKISILIVLSVGCFPVIVYVIWSIIY